MPANSSIMTALMVIVCCNRLLLAHSANFIKLTFMVVKIFLVRCFVPIVCCARGALQLPPSPSYATEHISPDDVLNDFHNLWNHNFFHNFSLWISVRSSGHHTGVFPDWWHACLCELHLVTTEKNWKKLIVYTTAKISLQMTETPGCPTQDLQIFECKITINV